ncbi:MAG: hypothetical protein ACLP1X_26235 [Polyangiaceae bacterium]
MSAVAWALVAHFFLVTALFLGNGHYHLVDGVLLLASCTAAGSALLRAPFPGGASAGRVQALAFCLALASTLSAFLRRPGDFVSTSLAPYYALSACAVGLIASYAREVRTGTRAAGRLAGLRPYGMLVVAFALGAWMLHASPSPRIDVWPIHQQGARALLAGQSPYETGTIATSDTFYDHDGKWIATYGYPPTNLILTAGAYALTGDTRWAVLVAMVTGAYLLWLVARGGAKPRAPWPDLLLGCSLFHPRGLFVLEQAWGDPLAVPFLVGFALAVTTGRDRTASVLLGLLCSVKQHFAIYGVVLAFAPGIGVSGALLALGTAAATYLPFAIASPHGLWQGLVEFHATGAFRADSLSLTAMIARAGFVLPSWVGMAATLGFFVVLPWMPRRLGALLLASTVAFFLFYVLGRQAFCNYYYVVCQTLLLAAAALAIETSPSGIQSR